MEQWQIEQNRILYGDSLGIRAVIQAVTSDTVIVVHNPYGITDAGRGDLHLVEGEDISVRDSTGATHRGKSQITNITTAGDLATLTISPSVAAMAATDIVVTGVPVGTHATDDSFAAEPHGLKSIVDVEAAFGTFEGISHPRWAAQKLTSSTIDEVIVMKLLNTIRAKGGVDWRANPKALLLLTSTGIWQTYGDALLGIRRFSPPPMELNGGFKGVQVRRRYNLRRPVGPTRSSVRRSHAGYRVHRSDGLRQAVVPGQPAVAAYGESGRVRGCVCLVLELRRDGSQHARRHQWHHRYGRLQPVDVNF